MRKPKRFDPHMYLNTDPAVFAQYKAHELQRIENEERKPVELNGRNAHGHAILMDHAEWYSIQYDDYNNVQPMEMPFPQPVDHGLEELHNFEVDDLVWHPWRWALVDPYEALLLPSRWGSAARDIAWVLWMSMAGQLSFPAGIGIGDNLDLFLMNNKDGYKKDNEQRDPDVRAKGLRQTAARMADQGWIQVFQDQPNELYWFIQETEQLKVAMPELIDKYPKQFGVVDYHPDAEEIQDLEVDLGKPTKMWRAGSRHWRARDGAHFYAPVKAAGNNPRQAVEAVVRGTPTSTSSITPTFASFQQVSEIVTPLSLEPYMEDLKNSKIFEAMAEIRNKPAARDVTDTNKCLGVFLPPDLIEIYNYVESKLDTKGKEFCEYSSKIKGVHGDALVILALSQLPTKDGTQRHVLRQIRLLTIALIQDLLGTIGGQFIDWTDEIKEKSES